MTPEERDAAMRELRQIQDDSEAERTDQEQQKADWDSQLAEEEWEGAIIESIIGEDITL